MTSRPAPLYLARHAETVFNRARIMQGNASHTPLTLRGIRQAKAMGEALRRHFDESGAPLPALWSSPAGRALQTASIIAEHLGVDFRSIRQDARLREIEVGQWVGRSYAGIIAEGGEILDRKRHLFLMPIPGGEQYADIAARLGEWLDDVDGQPLLAISHGITSRVLRGLLAGGSPYAGIPVADDLPQGSVCRIANGREEVLFRGDGDSAPASA